MEHLMKACRTLENGIKEYKVLTAHGEYTHFNSSNYSYVNTENSESQNLSSRSKIEPFDLLVMSYGTLDEERIPKFRKMVFLFMETFPLKFLYPELVQLFIELDIEFNVDLFYRSEIPEFAEWIQIFCVTSMVSEVPLIQELRNEIAGYLMELE